MQFLILGRTDQFKSFIYRNLNNDCWSVKALEGPHKGRVVFHAQYLAVSGGANAPHFGPDRGFIEFRVSEAGRQRVLREKRKNVHAGVVGYVYHAADVTLRYEDAVPARELFESQDYDISKDVIELPHPAYRKVTYNPYKGDRFVFEDTGEDAAITDDWDQDVVLDPAGKVYVMSARGLIQAHRERVAS